VFQLEVLWVGIGHHCARVIDQDRPGHSTKVAQPHLQRLEDGVGSRPNPASRTSAGRSTRLGRTRSSGSYVRPGRSLTATSQSIVARLARFGWLCDPRVGHWLSSPSQMSVRDRLPTTIAAASATGQSREPTNGSITNTRSISSTNSANCALGCDGR